LLRRFPYAIYFAVESDVVVVLAVLHVLLDRQKPVDRQVVRAVRGGRNSRELAAETYLRRIDLVGDPTERRDKGA
jgi:hypothetical protein